MIYVIQNKTQSEFARDYALRKNIIAIDTETNGLDPYTSDVLLVQVGDKKDQFVFDMGKLNKSAVKPLIEIFKNNDLLKLFHNSKFDYKMIKHHFGVSMDNVADTMLTELVLTKGVKKKGFGLDDLADKYRVGTKDKEIRENFLDMKLGDSFSKEELRYAANDVKILIPIYHKQLTIAENMNLTGVISLENSVAPCVGDMELNGIYISRDKWLDLEQDAIDGAVEVKKELDEYFKPYCDLGVFGEPIVNYDSPKQIVELMSKITGRQLEDSQEKTLKELNHPAAKLLLEYRGYSKLISTYGQKFLEHIHPKTGRIHPDFKQLGTDSGRMACRDPNLQNIKRDQKYRTPFQVQDEDWKFLSCDYGSQELVIMAFLSGEEKFVKAIEEERDLHSMVASLIFGIPEDEISKDLRTRAKAINYGLMYGLTKYGLARDLDISIDEAEELMNSFFTKFSKIKKFLDKKAKEVLKTHKAIAPLDNRLRSLESFDWTDYGKRGWAQRINKNHSIQATAASITKKALVRIRGKIKEYNLNAKLIGQIHDEVLVTCHENDLAETEKMVEKEMKKAFHDYCPGIKIAADVEVGNHWIH